VAFDLRGDLGFGRCDVALARVIFEHRLPHPRAQHFAPDTLLSGRVDSRFAARFGAAGCHEVLGIQVLTEDDGQGFVARLVRGLDRQGKDETKHGEQQQARKHAKHPAPGGMLSNILRQPSSVPDY
jgi:hypothetical protein